MNPAEQAHTFFEALLGGNGDLLAGCKLTVTSIYPQEESLPQTRWVPAKVSSIVSAVARKAAEPTATGVYFGVALTRGKGADAGRLTIADAVGLTAFWAEIDIAGPGHESRKPYPPDLESALSVSRCLGLEPTVIVHSGHGIHAYYRLNEPWLFGAVDVTDDGVPVIDESKVESDRARAAQLAWEFVTSMRIRAREREWDIDPTGDLARLMRAPGTLNRKLAGEALPVHIMEQSGAVYDLDQIEAVIAPKALLVPYTRTGAEVAGELAGIDLPRLWAQVQASPDHLPPWLASVLESPFDQVLCEFFDGTQAANKQRYPSDSELDQGLAATILRLGLTPAQAAQAIMALRCRHGRKVEKVDPAERTDYLLKFTLPKVIARRKAEAAAKAANESRGDVIAEFQAQQPATNVTSDEPTYNETADSLKPDEPPAPVAQLHRSEATPDPYVEHADAPRSPRLGRDRSTPAGPNETEEDVGRQLGAIMGLPAGVAIWAVGERRLEKVNEFRVWLVRNGQSVVRGGTWRPNTVRATRWHPQSAWDTGPKMVGIMMRDLHLQVETPAAAAWRDEGYPRMFDLSRPMEEGTPAEAARQSVIALLRRAEGTSVFSTAITSREPWLGPDGVWVAMDSIRAAIGQAGFTAQPQRLLVDTLDDMGCKVQTGMAVAEEHRTVRDELSWVLLADDIFTDELMAHVRLRAADRDAADARSGLRMIGGQA